VCIQTDLVQVKNVSLVFQINTFMQMFETNRTQTIEDIA